MHLIYHHRLTSAAEVTVSKNECLGKSDLKSAVPLLVTQRMRDEKQVQTVSTQHIRAPMLQTCHLSISSCLLPDEYTLAVPNVSTTTTKILCIYFLALCANQMKCSWAHIHLKAGSTNSGLILISELVEPELENS